MNSLIKNVLYSRNSFFFLKIISFPTTGSTALAGYSEADSQGRRTDNNFDLRQLTSSMHTPYYIFEENGGDYGEIVERAYLLMSQTSISSAVSLEDELRAFIQIQYPFPPDPLATDPLLPWRLSFLLRHLECGTGSELFRLLLEARPHSSKWFDPGRLGQAELYEGLERVLLDLKAFSPHSTPFLHRVSKKAVPDYCNVILRPMDLGTMHKKLRNREYASKQEFAADLQLIHDNCLTYNTEEVFTPCVCYLIVIGESVEEECCAAEGKVDAFDAARARY